MQAGEMVVARLSGGLTIGRCLVVAEKGQRVRISVGRNREASLPAARIILTTGVAASGGEELEEFRRRCDDLASGIDMTEVWEVVRDEDTPFSLDDLAELYWGTSPDVAQCVALLLHLDRTSPYFVEEKRAYIARSEDVVREMLARRRRVEENAQGIATLAAHLSQGSLPQSMTRYQSDLIRHLRGFAVHGEDYTRSAAARNLLGKVQSGTRAELCSTGTRAQRSVSENAPE